LILLKVSPGHCAMISPGPFQEARMRDDLRANMMRTGALFALSVIVSVSVAGLVIWEAVAALAR